METASLWGQVAEATRQLLNAGWVQITHFEETEPLITIKGVSYFVPPELNRLMTVTQTLVSPLDPFHRAHQPTVNRVMRQLYLEGQTVCAPLEDFLCDILSPELCQSLAYYANLRLVCATPLWYRGRVSGALIAYGMSDPNGPALQLLAQLASLIWFQEQAQGNTQGELEALQRAALEWIALSSHHRHELADILASQIQTRLIALMWRLDDVLDGLTPDESWIPTLSQIREQLSQTAYQDIANMSHAMYPPTLRLGLIAALSTLLAEHSTCNATLAADDVVHNWDYPTNNRIPFSVRLAMYQIVEDYLKIMEEEGIVSQTQLKLSALGNTLCLNVTVQDPLPSLAPFPRKLAEQQIKLLSGQVFWAEDGHRMAIVLPILAPSINLSRSPG